MANLNKVILLGNVTREPEVRYLQNGTAVCKFGLAVNRKFKDKEETLFIDLAAFGRLAEIAGEYLTKGNPVLVEGRLKLNQWEKDGEKRSKHEIIVENIQLLGGGKGKSDDSNNDYEESDIPF